MCGTNVWTKREAFFTMSTRVMGLFYNAHTHTALCVGTMIIDLLPGILGVPHDRVRSVWTFQYRPVDVPYAYMREAMRLAHPNPDGEDACQAQPDRSILLALGSFPDDASVAEWYASVVAHIRERRFCRVVVSLEIPGVLVVRAISDWVPEIPGIPRIAIDVLAGRPIRDPRASSTSHHVIQHARRTLDDTYLPFWEWMNRRHERVTALRHWFPSVKFQTPEHYEKCIWEDHN